MSLREALRVRVGAVLVAVPSIAVAGTVVRPTEAVAAVAVWRLASRLYRLNAVEGGSGG